MTASTRTAQSLLSLQVGSISDPLNTGNGLIVVELKGFKDSDPAAYEKYHAIMTDGSRQIELPRVDRAWIAERIAQGEQSGKIRIFYDRVKDYLAGKYQIQKQDSGGFGGYY